MKFKETLVPVIGGNIVELSAWDKTRFQDIGDTFFALSWTLWANHYYIYVQLSALNDWATFPYWTECKKTWIRRTLFERIYSEISSNPINQSFRSKFIKATKNNVIRKIYILHFNRIRIDLDTNYLFKNLQRTSTSSNLPRDRGCCAAATTKFLPCLPFGWGQFDVLFTLAREITASGRTEWKKRVNDIGERRLCGAAPIVKGFSAGSGTRSFPEMT